MVCIFRTWGVVVDDRWRERAVMLGTWSCLGAASRRFVPTTGFILHS